MEADFAFQTAAVDQSATHRQRRVIFSSNVEPCVTGCTFKEPFATRMRFVEMSNSNSITTNARDHASQQASGIAGDIVEAEPALSLRCSATPNC